mmetsp:Transcript_18932/g.42922  ORF Transcript_18932/g.42922 Transcript_18932/m.42922 type:complete len:301 (-) Transcript_18932:90-992(-)
MWCNSHADTLAVHAAATAGGRRVAWEDAWVEQQLERVQRTVQEDSFNGRQRSCIALFTHANSGDPWLQPKGVDPEGESRKDYALRKLEKGLVEMGLGKHQLQEIVVHTPRGLRLRTHVTAVTDTGPKKAPREQLPRHCRRPRSASEAGRRPTSAHSSRGHGATKVHRHQEQHQPQQRHQPHHQRPASAAGRRERALRAPADEAALLQTGAGAGVPLGLDCRQQASATRHAKGIAASRPSSAPLRGASGRRPQVAGRAKAPGAGRDVHSFAPSCSSLSVSGSACGPRAAWQNQGALQIAVH